MTTPTLKTCFERVKRYVEVNSLAIKDPFIDFDRNFRNIITRSQFTRVCTFLNLPITSAEMKETLDAFDRGDGMVLYREFLEIVDVKLKEFDETILKIDQHIKHKETFEKEQILRFIKKAFLIQPVRFEEQFYSFDRLKSGFISKSNAQTAICTMLPSFVPYFESLFDIYQQDDKFNYRNFLNDLNLYLEEDFVQEDIIDLNSLPEHLREIYSKIHFFVQTQNIHLKPSFFDFDRNNRGIISSTQFMRVFTQLKIPISSHELELLVQHLEKDNLIHYRQFLIFVDKDVVYQDKFDVLNNSMPITVSILKQGNEERALKNIAELIKKHSIRVEQFFIDYDHLRRGKIHFSKFCVALNQLRLSIPAEDIEAVSNSEKIRSGDEIDYRKFIRMINSLNREDNTTSLTVDSIGDLIERMRNVMRVENVSLKAIFQDFDKHNSRKVSVHHFKTALNIAGFQLDTASLNRLVRVFCPDNNDCIYYPDLLEILDPSNIQIFDITAKSTKVNISKRHRSRATLIHTLQRVVKTKSIKLDEYLAEGDRLNVGKITVSWLHRSLNKLGFDCSLEEAEIIAGPYFIDDNKETMNWRSFWEKFMALPDFEDQIVDIPSELVLDLNKIKNFVQQQRILLKPFFKDMDFNKRLLITTSQFAGALSRANVPVSSLLLNKIIKWLDNGEGLVQYNYFLQAIEE
eukprot:TRINITY_DN2991_c0_g1_i2.p1 TRINITY_DN2991_c0_g1~~TRINITY_DN2991_c0_g1_i2.p1  ORF type:complete len:687 (-),score=198.87 TRINITY_DN2991_c0_g1_i2:31-2091(-)